MQDQQKKETRFSSMIYLVICILSDVSAITCMKLSHGFTHLIPSLLIFVFYGTSIFSLVLGLKYWELGRAYAIWSGMGTFLAFAVGILFFHEPLTLVKGLSVSLIIIGVMGLRGI